MDSQPALTVVMPCLNEAETLEQCIRKAQEGIARCGVAGEVLIADNGSTDGSQEIAKRLGARVERVAEKGYGNALRGGIKAARGKWIVMGDADDSYDFTEIEPLVQKLKEGCELVMGCRLSSGGGTIVPGAMPWKNRWLGNPVLSFLGRTFFRTLAHDFHCGLRAFTRDAFERMDMRTTGMEFASEMLMKATLKGMRVAEVPITLHPDGRSRPPHLKPWRDGWRHLRFMLIYSPRWLFLLPGIVLLAVGFLSALGVAVLPVKIGGATFDVGTLTVACMLVLVGFQMVAFAVFTKVFAIAEGLLPADVKFSRLFKFLSLETGLVAGVATLLVGVLFLARAIWIWHTADFGTLPYGENLRRIVPSGAAIVLGIQIISASFFLSVLGLKTTARTPPGSPGEQAPDPREG